MHVRMKGLVHVWDCHKYKNQSFIGNINTLAYFCDYSRGLLKMGTTRAWVEWTKQTNMVIIIYLQICIDIALILLLICT